MNVNKEKALEVALGQIERQFGKGTVMRMGENDRPAIPSISTGSLGEEILCKKLDNRDQVDPKAIHPAANSLSKLPQMNRHHWDLR